MNISRKIYLRLKNTMNLYNINIVGGSLRDIDTGAIYRQIIILQSQKKISSTEYSLLSKVKKQLEIIKEYNDEQSYSNLEATLNNIESYNGEKSFSKSEEFINIMQNISSSSKESIINSEHFNSFNEYMHVTRPIEEKLKSMLGTLQEMQKGLVLLVGSVGDGKSHLLSYLNKNHKHLFDRVEIYNDATESNNPYKTAVETLSEKLNEYEEDYNKKIVVAINIGMLYKLTAYLKEKKLSNYLRDVINDSEIFDNDNIVSSKFHDEGVSIISFLNEKPFSVENGEIKSEFYDQIIQKIFKTEQDNPFYNKFLVDDGHKRKEHAYQNYKLLLNPTVQKTIKMLLIKIQIENKRMITTRGFLNFIHDIIIPDEEKKQNDMFLVNLLFDKGDKSPILQAMKSQDPILVQSSWLDELNIEIYNTANLYHKCEEIFGEHFEMIREYLYLLDDLSHRRKFEVIIRLHYLFNFNKYGNHTFQEFINIIENIEQDKTIKLNLLKKVVNAIELWNDTPLEGYIYKEILKPDTKLRVGLEFKPKSKNIYVTKNMTIKVEMELQNELHDIEIDYNLYRLLTLLEYGYLLKESDKSEAVVFDEFVDKILNTIKSKETTIISMTNSNEKYLIKEGFMGYEIRSIE